MHAEGLRNTPGHDACLQPVLPYPTLPQCTTPKACADARHLVHAERFHGKLPEVDGRQCAPRGRMPVIDRCCHSLPLACGAVAASCSHQKFCGMLCGKPLGKHRCGSSPGTAQGASASNSPQLPRPPAAAAPHPPPSNTPRPRRAAGPSTALEASRAAPQSPAPLTPLSWCPPRPVCALCASQAAVTCRLRAASARRPCCAACAATRAASVARPQAGSQTGFPAEFAPWLGSTACAAVVAASMARSQAGSSTGL